MPYYFMRDTPLQALEQLMMSQPGQKPRGGGIYRSPFHYTPKDVACEYCQNYDRKHSCRLYECTCPAKPAGRKYTKGPFFRTGKSGPFFFALI